MGHISSKNVYRDLGKKIDSLTMRVPWNKAFYEILKELYTEEEADFIIKMPYGLSVLEQIKQSTEYDEAKIKNLLESLCSKGLVIDLYMLGKFRYMISPMIIGIFEFTMMRTGEGLNSKKWAELFNDYMFGSNKFFKKNFRDKKVSVMRTLPHEEVIEESQHVEVLDYEKAEAIIRETKKFAISICACRHEKYHLDEKKCDVPLETCSTFGISTEYFIRRKLAREASQSEMLENLARAKEMGLVLNADNVQKRVSYMCQCCKCCCNVLLGISTFGYPETVVTSSYIANVDEELCVSCGKCVEACPINAIELPEGDKPCIDRVLCLGCGVCGLQCKTGAMKLVKREQRVLHPETTFQRVILQCLERGTLQNQMFRDPGNISHKFMRGFIGGFLKLPPVKKALMSDMLRSSFLNYMEEKVRRKR